MKYTHCSFLVIGLFILATVACTDFQEEETVSWGVDLHEIYLPSDSPAFSLTVTSRTKWEVQSAPEWISLRTIKHSGVSPYEWTAVFSVSANHQYDREGLIIIKAGINTDQVLVVQDGAKGKFIAVESVSVSPTEWTLTEGDSALLTYSIIPSNASVKDVEWTSSAPSVVSVSSSGFITAKTVGTATITVTTSDGQKTASCTVRVSPKKSVIRFADADLKQYLLSYYDTDRDLEISYEEAAAATTIVPLNSVRTITSFDEFQYFTGVQTVPDNWLNGCPYLKSVVLPPSILTIGKSAFADCSSLSGINLNKGISVGAGAFKGTSLSGTVHVASFKGDAFSGTAVSKIFEHSPALYDYYDFDICLLSIPTSCTISIVTNVYSSLNNIIWQISADIPKAITDFEIANYERIELMEQQLAQIESEIQMCKEETYGSSQVERLRASLYSVKEYYYASIERFEYEQEKMEKSISSYSVYFQAAYSLFDDLNNSTSQIAGAYQSLSARISTCEAALDAMDRKAPATTPNHVPARTAAKSGAYSYSIDEIVTLFNTRVTSFEE